MSQVLFENCTVLDTEMGQLLPDHHVLIEDGRIEEQGPPEQIFGDPRSPHLQQFIRSIA